MARRQGKTKRNKPKTILRFPDLEQSKNAVVNSLAAASSQESYGQAIDEFIGWYCSEPRLAFNRTVVLRYRFFLEQKNLAPSTIKVRLAAVRRLAYEASDSGLLSPELAAGIRRVKGAKRLGTRIGNWLTADQCRSLLRAPCPDTLRGEAGSGNSGGSHRVRSQTRRVGWATGRRPSNPGGALGCGRSNWQGQAHPNDSDAGLGQTGGGCLDAGCGHHDRLHLSHCRQKRRDLG
jgi:hypothetical protein